MARNIKKGLDYFSVDTEWDRKMRLIKAKYGLEGIGFVIELWKMIYREGYFIIWDDETELLFADENKITVSKGIEMMHFGIGKGLFRIFNIKNQTVITSRGIQKRYFETSLKRVEVHFCREILLINPEIPDWSKTKILWDSITDVLDSKTPVSDSETTINDSEIGVSEQEVSKKVSKEVSKEHTEASPSASPAEINSPLQNPQKTKDIQLQELATNLRDTDPQSYNALLKQHPELEEDPPFNTKPP